MANIIRRGSEPRLTRPSTGEWASDPFRALRELLRWDPFAEIEPLAGGERAFSPRFDVKETNSAYVFRADLPGVKESDLDISLTGNQLRVAGERKEEKVEESDRSYVSEVSYGSFSRVFTMPEGCDSEHAAAEMKDGVLTVTLPKKPEVQPKKINIGSKTESKGKA